jgi:hypothetical protein
LAQNANFFRGCEPYKGFFGIFFEKNHPKIKSRVSGPNLPDLDHLILEVAK